MKQTWSQKSQKLLKTALNKLISNISIFAIIAALIIICACYAGLTFSVSTHIVVTVAVSSIVLAASSLIIYELWVKNGIQNAKTEQEYIDLLDTYEKKSKDINAEVMQEFIEAEKKRRQDVAEKKIETEIERVEKIITRLSDSNTFITKCKLKANKRRLQRLKHLKDTVIVDMPYQYSEQFDQLRYSTGDATYKEYKPNDTVMFIRKKRTRKYIMLATTTLVGLNSVSLTVGGENWLIALFMTAISAVTLVASMASGFSNGYNSISISSTGVYKTAISFIEKAEAYCKKYNKALRYNIDEVKDDIPEDHAKTSNNVEPIEVKAEESQITMNIFDKVSK